MSTATTSFAHRLAACGLAGVAAAAAWFAAVRPGLARVEALKEEIAAERALAGALAAVGDQSAERDAAMARAAELRARAFVAGGSEAVEIANLQALVTAAAVGSGLRFTSLRTLPPLNRDGLTLIGVRAEVAAPLDKIQALLHRLETAEPRLVIQAADLLAVPRPAGADAVGQPPVDIGVNVYGAVVRDRQTKPAAEQPKERP